MFSKVILIMLCSTAIVAGQGRGGGGGGGADQAGGDTMSARALTPFEAFAGKLTDDEIKALVAYVRTLKK